MRKLLPIGIQDFSRLIEGNFLYVDKTKYILDIIEKGDCYFLLRPRRFGKSLLLSTLHEIFAGNRELFNGLYIGQSEYAWPQHPVVHLSFSSLGVDNVDDLKKTIEWTLGKHAVNYDISIDDAPTLKTKFIALIERLALKNRVVILIDEYDYPLISNITNQALAEECRQVLHDFFIVLKDLSKYIRFIFITGVTQFSKTSIFSGLNNLNDLTLKKSAAVLLGYTQEEIRHSFDSYLTAIANEQSSSIDRIMDLMREWYNGYVFAAAQKKEPVKVYNPTSILFYLEEGIVQNYWAETGTPSFIAYLIKSQRYPISEIEGLEVNQADTKLYDIGKIKFIALLW